MNRSRLHEAFSLQLKRKEKVENHFAQAPTWPANTAVCPRSSPPGMFRGRHGETSLEGQGARRDY